ncbi:MAG: tetratricopeptide repeat protein [Cycloclasticus sp.]|nr:tetratricopeptide repeat protein [Cycloclasticus sp.]
MFLRWLSIITVAFLSFACAHVGSGSTEKTAPAIKEQAVVENEDAQKTDQVVEPSQLDAALLYSILGGEIAGQRGEVNIASAFYADAAQRSQNPQLALRAAQIALYTKDIAAAKSAVDIFIEDEHATLQSHYLALTVYLRAGDIEKSKRQIRLLLVNSDIPLRNTLLAIGDLVSRNASEDVAKEMMDELVATNSDEAASYLARSQIMLNFGTFDAAEKDAAKTIQLDSKWQTGYAMFAQILEKKGNTKEALIVLKEASAKFKTAELMTGYGQLLAKDGQYQAAKEVFSHLLVKEVDHVEAMFSLGLVYLKLEEVSQAKEIFEGLYAKRAFQSKTAFYLGQITYRQKEYESAISWFEKVGQGPIFIDSQVNIAMINAEMDDLPAARSVLQRLRNRFPKNSARFYILEAEFLIEAAQHKALYQLMTEAIVKDPDNLALRYARSIAANEIGELKIAEQDLLFVLAHEPGNVNALNALGYTLASKTFRFKEARKYLTQALSLKPDDSAIIDSMGWLNYREGHYEEALALLEAAYRKSPEGEIAAHLGETLWMLGRQEEAKRIWQEGLKRFPSDKHLIEVLKRLK